jgi:hypothetical protein
VEGKPLDRKKNEIESERKTLRVHGTSLYSPGTTGFETKGNRNGKTFSKFG